MSEGNTRDDFIAGLRDLADFFDAHPTVKARTYFDYDMVVRFYQSESDIMVAARDAAPWDKEYDTNFLNLTRTFGPILLELYCFRSDICTPKATKVEVITEPDPDWLRAEIAKLKELQPTRTVEKETVTEWDCRPLLAAAESGSVPS